MTEARNVKRFEFQSYVRALEIREQETFRLVVAAVKVLLLKTLSPKRVAGLGGFIECQSCGSVGATSPSIRPKLFVGKFGFVARGLNRLSGTLLARLAVHFSEHAVLRTLRFIFIYSLS